MTFTHIKFLFRMPFSARIFAVIAVAVIAVAVFSAVPSGGRIETAIRSHNLICFSQ